jgi:uncharacterized protein (DUF3084 family)
MTTIKIKPSHLSQGEFVLIEKADFDPSKHELLDGESLGNISGDTDDGVPTLAELIAGRDQLVARKEQLDDLELQLNQRSNVLDDREQALAEHEGANEREALRLADLAAAHAAAGKLDFAAMTKDQLKAALVEKGTQFPSTADKADLIALLTAA